MHQNVLFLSILEAEIKPELKIIPDALCYSISANTSMVSMRRQ